jgi:hypothetical protein
MSILFVSRIFFGRPRWIVSAAAGRERSGGGMRVAIYARVACCIRVCFSLPEGNGCPSSVVAVRMNVSAEAVFVRNASAPEANASSSICGELCIEKMRIFVEGASRRMLAAAWRPFSTGMLRSNTTRSGFSSRTKSIACCPFSASPQTVHCGCPLKIAAILSERLRGRPLEQRACVFVTARWVGGLPVAEVIFRAIPFLL